MKLLYTALIISLILCFNGIQLNAQNVNIPDANFEAYLLGNNLINTNSDTLIQLTEAQAFTGSMNCSYLSIMDLAGIEAFINISYLACAGNQLTNLDLGQNTSLTELYCEDNQLMSLNLSLNTSLTDLACEDNQLTSLDLSLNTSLINLYCGNNQLMSLDLSQNVSLEQLYFESNQLINISKGY